MSEETKKKLSRRKFVALTGGALAASGLLAACGDNTATTAPAATTAAAAATTAAAAATTAAPAATTAVAAATTAASAATTAAAGAATTAASAATTAASAATTAAAGAPFNSGFKVTSDNITLSIWADDAGMAPWYQKVTEAYTKLHPNVKFDVQAFAVRDFETKIAAAVPSDTAADILQGSPTTLRKYIEPGLVPKNPDSVTKIVSDPAIFPKELTDNLVFNNTYYGMPFYQGRHAIYYNTDYFTAAGLTTPPATMDDLTTYAQKLVKVEGGNMTVSGLSLRLTGAGSGIAEKFMMFLYPNGGNILAKTADGKYHNDYNNEAGLKTLKMYIDMVYKYKTDDPKVKHDTDAFQTGATAMYARESNVVGDTAKKAPNLKYNTAPMPKGVRWGDLSSPIGLYTSRSTKNADTAWDFIMFSQQEQYLNLLLTDIGWIPQRQDYAYAEALKARPQYAAFTFKDPNYKLFVTPAIASFDELETKLADRLSKAYLDSSLLDNEAKMKQVLADAAKETDDILKKAGIYGV
jgi:multiple sugar transport system substrate-binding protein